MVRVYGIDLGTTYSAAATMDERSRPFCFEVDDRRLTLPSVVFLEKVGTKVIATVGSKAFERYQESEPNNGKLIQASKRYIGSPPSNNPYKEPPWRFDNWAYDSRDIAALILRKIALKAREHYPNEPLTEAVITHPAFFPVPAKNATKQAAELAGIRVIGMITEPTAAVLAYGVEQQREGRCLVFDLGGGTLDVTLCEIDKSGVICVKEHKGDSHLGGIDFDRVILEMAVEQFTRTYADVDFDTVDEKQKLKWLRKACQVKEGLSGDSSFREEPFTLSWGRENLRKRLQFERSEFERRSQGLLTRCFQVVKSVLQNQNLKWDDIDDILLVGGATRMPMIQRMLSEVSGKKIEPKIDPDLCVAIGATLLAQRLAVAAGSQERPVEVVKTAPTEAPKEEGIKIPAVRDALSRAVRVLALTESGREICHLVIDKGTPLPTEKEQRYVTATDGQTAICVKVYEGESEEKDYNSLIGEVRVEGLPSNRPAGQPVLVKFAVSSAGQLAVCVVDEKTGKMGKNVLDCVGASEADLDKRKQLLDQIEVE